MTSGGDRVRRVVIVGGGSSGWMCAAGIARIVPSDVTVTLVESSEIGTIGVGEATVPSLAEFNAFLGVSEDEMLRATGGSIKLGIDFVDWFDRGTRYFHPFGFYGRDTPEFPFHQLWLRLADEAGHDPRDPRHPGEIGDYNLCTVAARLGRFAPAQGGRDAILGSMRHAYHIDATRYAAMLRAYAEQRGVRRIEGRIVTVARDGESGLVEAVELESGEAIDGDLFVDCSGFRSLLLGSAMGEPWVDWQHYLPCDRAVAVGSALPAAPDPFTRATADAAGWRWRIPLQHRTGNGHVYCSALMSEDEATRRLLDGLDGAAEGDPRALRFATGHRRALWRGNCVAIGLAGGFIEPLESTGIHLVQMGLHRLIGRWPGRIPDPALIADYNRQMTREYEYIRDFIVLHYAATRRDDTPFWRRCRAIDLPDTLAAKIELFRAGGRLNADPDDLFTTHSWLAVMLGQGIVPRGHDPLADRIDAGALAENMLKLRRAVLRTAEHLPTHADYLRAPGRAAPARPRLRET